MCLVVVVGGWSSPAPLPLPLAHHTWFSIKFLLKSLCINSHVRLSESSE